MIIFKFLTSYENFTLLGVAAISFLRPAEDTPSSAQFATGTGHKHVRLYDIKASQQPSFSIDIGGEYRITSIQPTKDGNALFVGDCSGTVLNSSVLYCAALFGTVLCRAFLYCALPLFSALHFAVLECLSNFEYY